MKKKIALLSIALMVAAAGVASAGAAWGKYKGYDIIRLTVNGKTIKAIDAPAISFNDRTMIPVYMLKDAGIRYSWDGETNTVDIKQSSTSGIDWKGIFKHLKSYNVYALSLGITNQLDAITADYNGTSDQMTDEEYLEIMRTLAYSSASYFQIYFINGSSFSYTSSKARDYFEGRITLNQLMSSATVDK